MDSRIGLDYIVENKEYTAKLAAALDTDNVTVKKQVFELLCALCVYNQDGYHRALDALEHFKNQKEERYRFKIVIRELQNNNANPDYQMALVAFVNCLLISTAQLKDRIRLRNEFLGLRLLDVINELRKVASSQADLAVQLDVFDEQRESDESQVQGPHGVDLSSHVDVFYALLRQVLDTPQEIPFLSILQHLLQIDPKEPVSDVIWDTAERLVHRATLLESKEDAGRLLRAPSQAKSLTKIKGSSDTRCFCSCHRDHSGGRKQSSHHIDTTGGTHPLPPAPPLPPPPGNLAPPPPPLPVSGGSPSPPPPPLPMGGPKPPPIAAPTSHSTFSSSPNTSPIDQELKKVKLPQMETPKPKTKMKTINWNKIPNHKVLGGRRNLWSMVAEKHQNVKQSEQLDWEEMEGLFCQQPPPPPPIINAGGVMGSPKLGRDDSRKRESSEIVLLDGKRSLNVNIFLKQFRSSHDDIVHLIREGAHDAIGAERIRGLLKLLPEQDELEMLKAFDGDKLRLGNAEKFLLALTKVPNYRLRVESMLLKEEFSSNMGYLAPSINAMIMAADDLKHNKELQEVLYMVLVAGNFLNSGGYAGNAAGVKLSSLQKLTDIRANKPGMNLLHYVALQLEKTNMNLLKFPQEMSALEEATKTTTDNLSNEIKALDSRIAKISQQIQQPAADKDIKKQMTEFLQMAAQEMKGLREDLDELEGVRVELSDFFCEDPSTFKLEETFKTFHIFCTRFKQAVTENERRKLQEEQAEQRRKQREEQLRRKQLAGQNGQHQAPSGSESETNFDLLLGDIRAGVLMRRNSDKDKNRKAKRDQLGLPNGVPTSEDDLASLTGSPCLVRRRIGSFSGQQGTGAPNEQKDDTYSPDITPTGSLRRRRSRVPSEEEETLMDFLRASGHDGSRERKSWTGGGVELYGSLDRSWARRARGGGSSRVRPTLLNADFGEERERATSPALQQNSAASTPTGDIGDDGKNKSSPWRQKIEAWLESSEQEESKAEEMRRRRRIHRRSADMENEDRPAPLDTLPEGKPGCEDNKSEYQRVYKDWRPTIDKTDVVGAMEAIEGAQSPTVKDKSPWRKSNLNVANSSEATETEARRLRRMRSRGAIDDGLQVIQEDSARKDMIGSLGKQLDSDRLTLYIRRPSEDTESLENNSAKLKLRNSSVPNESSRQIDRPEFQRSSSQEDKLPPSVPKHLRRKTSDDNVPNITADDVDAENIETPPVQRKTFGYRSFRQPSEVDDEFGSSKRQNRRFRSFATQKSNSSDDKDVVKKPTRYNRSADTAEQVVKTENIGANKQPAKPEEDLGDGNFDRFSANRRTRRYRRSQNDSESKSPERKASLPFAAEISVTRPSIEVAESSTVEKPTTETERLQQWQSKLKTNHDPAPEDSSSWTARLARKFKPSETFSTPQISRKSPSPAQDTPPISTGLFTRSVRDKRDRTRSMIDPKQVDEAFKKGASGVTNINRTSHPSPSIQRMGFIRESVTKPSPQSKTELIPTIRIQSAATAGTKVGTKPEIEHDEGFEDNHSSMSESPNQGNRNSSFRIHNADNTKKHVTQVMIGNGLNSGKLLNGSSANILLPSSNGMNGKLVNGSSSSILLPTTPTAGETNSKATSLRSSRSSLTSGTSAVTAIQRPEKSPCIMNSLTKSLKKVESEQQPIVGTKISKQTWSNKKPFTSQKTTGLKTSVIEKRTRQPSASSKENLSRQNSASTSRSSSLKEPTNSNTIQNLSSSSRSTKSSDTNSAYGTHKNKGSFSFMRPTASSSAKDKPTSTTDLTQIKSKNVSKVNLTRFK